MVTALVARTSSPGWSRTFGKNRTSVLCSPPRSAARHLHPGPGGGRCAAIGIATERSAATRPKNNTRNNNIKNRGPVCCYWNRYGAKCGQPGQRTPTVSGRPACGLPGRRAGPCSSAPAPAAYPPPRGRTLNILQPAEPLEGGAQGGTLRSPWDSHSAYYSPLYMGVLHGLVF